MNKNPSTLPPAYEGIERQLMAVYYSGVYITNRDIVHVAQTVGLTLPLKDRTALLKELMGYAHEKGLKKEIMQGFAALFHQRIQSYQNLLEHFPQTAPVLNATIQKAQATARLLQKEARSHPYDL